MSKASDLERLVYTGVHGKAEVAPLPGKRLVSVGEKKPEREGGKA